MFFRRILAFIIDHITICFGIGLISSFHLIYFANETSFNTLQSFVYGYSILIWYVYMVLRDSFFGKSIGKKVMRLSIKKITDETQECSRGNLIRRNITLMLLPFEVILFLFNKKNRRLGDLWAGSIVLND